MVSHEVRIEVQLEPGMAEKIRTSPSSSSKPEPLVEWVKNKLVPGLQLPLVKSEGITWRTSTVLSLLWRSNALDKAQKQAIAFEANLKVARNNTIKLKELCVTSLVLLGPKPNLHPTSISANSARLPPSDTNLPPPPSQIPPPLPPTHHLSQPLPTRPHVPSSSSRNPPDVLSSPTKEGATITQLTEQLEYFRSRFKKLESTADDDYRRYQKYKRDYEDAEADLATERSKRISLKDKISTEYVPKAVHEALRLQLDEERQKRTDAERSSGLSAQEKEAHQLELEKTRAEADRLRSTQVQTAVSFEYAKWTRYVQQEYERRIQAEGERDAIKRLLEELQAERDAEVITGTASTTAPVSEDLSRQLQAEREAHARTKQKLQDVHLRISEEISLFRQQANDIRRLYTEALQQHAHKMSTARSELSDLTSRFDAENSLLRTKVDVMRARVEAAASAVAEERSAFNAKEQQFRANALDLAYHLCEAEEKLANSVAEKEAAVQRVEEQAREHTAAIASQTLAERALTSVLHKSSVEQKRLEDDLSSTQEQLSASQKRVDQLLSERASSFAEQRDCATQIGRLRTELESVKAELSLANIALRHAERDADGERERYHETQSRLRAANRRVEEAERARAVAEQMQADFEKELQRPEILPSIMSAFKDIVRMSAEATVSE